MSHLTLIRADQLPVKNWHDRYELHRDVMGLFDALVLPGEPNQRRAGINVLFRVDETKTGRVILVRSDVAPTNLPRGAQTHEEPELTLEPGTEVRFRLTANPIKGGRGRGDTAREVHDLEAWAGTRLTPALDSIVVLTTNRTDAHIKGTRLRLEQLDGIATVADPAVLANLLRSGVGRAKAFGAGLLSVRA